MTINKAKFEAVVVEAKVKLVSRPTTSTRTLTLCR